MKPHLVTPAPVSDAQEYVEAVIKAHGKDRAVMVSGREFEVHERVFDPTIAPSGAIGMCFAALPFVQGKRVADVGAGSGIFSCLFALNGAKAVVATDVSTPALANTKANVARHGLERNVEIRAGGALAPIRETDLVDVIYCDLPFADWRTPESDLDAAFFDVGLGVISDVLNDFSTRPEFSAAELYLCTSSLSEQWQRNIAFSRNLKRAKVLSLDREWIELELWRILRR